MPKKESKQPYKPNVVFKYTIRDIAGLAGMTRNALNVAKVRGKIDPGDFKSVGSFLTRRIIDRRLCGDLFKPIGGPKGVNKRRSGAQVSSKKTKKTARSS